MKYIANIEVGGFKKGEEVPKEKGELWRKVFEFSPVDIVEDDKEKEKELSPKSKERLNDIKEDLKDDGKINYSHDPKRKSPGRRKKKKKK